MWAVRCYHEAQLHADNCFVTLTYDDAHLPPGGSLVGDELSLFFKRLRKKIGARIKHFSCGEYGDENWRPHYHAIIFGYAFPDRVHWQTKKGNKYYRSKELESCWSFGHSIITDFSLRTAEYVAQYVIKKRTGDDAAEHYERVDLETGEIFNLLPEFSRMSLRPAIAKEWWEKFGQSVKDWDTVVVDGKEIPPPRYYDRLLEEEEPERLAAHKLRRVRKAKGSPDNTPERLRVRERCQQLKQERRERGL